MYKQKTELLPGKSCWKGHFSKTLNNCILTPLPIRTIHKYPFSLCSRDLEEGPFYSPVSSGWEQEARLASEIGAQHQLHVALEVSAHLTSVHRLALVTLCLSSMHQTTTCSLSSLRALELLVT